MSPSGSIDLPFLLPNKTGIERAILPFDQASLIKAGGFI